jgi:uncharacterized protein YbbC (DUF1343 family)
MGTMKFHHLLFFLLLLSSLHAGASERPSSNPILVGADVFLRGKLPLLEGKRVGVVTNHTALCASGEHLVSALLRKGVNVVRLFGPEHGIRGAAGPGEIITDTLDLTTRIPVVSLYGSTNKPTRAMLQDIDLLLYDIQDVGARFYTYVSTMVLCMEAAAEARIPFVVLDRPNPLGGLLIDGPVLEDSLRSFVGIVPVPVVYGLTPGELALFVNGEGLLKGKVQADLTVITMEGWNRSMTWEESGIRWIPPSPNIPDPETAIVYPATCILEATNLSEGRGTTKPFKIFGSPFVDGERLASGLNARNIPGVTFGAVRFRPLSSKHSGKECGGVEMVVTGRELFRPVRTGLQILREVQRLFPEDFTLDRKWFLKLIGSAPVFDGLRSGKSLESIESAWSAKTSEFKTKSRKYLMYP